MANFDCSFNTHFRQWAEMSSTEKSIFVRDFVIPFKPHDFFFTIDQSTGLVNDAREVGLVEQVVHSTSIQSQESLMFDHFAEAIWKNEIQDSFWSRISLLTQKVLDACLKSSQQSGQLVFMTN